MALRESLGLEDLGPSFPEDEDGRRRRLSLLAYLPCPIRAQTREALHARILALEALGDRVPWYLPGGCGGHDAYENLWHCPSLDDYPDLIASLGFGDFFRPAFRDRFLGSGDFGYPEPASEAAENPAFIAAGIPDPKSRYLVYAVFLYVMLIDRGRLAGRSPPRRWLDLLDPQWRGELMIGGGDDEISDVLLRFVYRDRGMEGVKALAANVKSLEHAASMAKLSGSGGPKVAAISVLPYFFADTRSHREESFIHIPAEGALTSPLYLLQKRKACPASRDCLNFFLSPQMTEICHQAFYPSRFHPGTGSQAQTLSGIGLNWIGWDFIDGHDLNELDAECQRVFRSAQPIRPARPLAPPLLGRI